MLLSISPTLATWPFPQPRLEIPNILPCKVCVLTIEGCLDYKSSFCNITMVSLWRLGHSTPSHSVKLFVIAPSPNKRKCICSVPLFCSCSNFCIFLLVGYGPHVSFVLLRLPYYSLLASNLILWKEDPNLYTWPTPFNASSNVHNDLVKSMSFSGLHGISFKRRMAVCIPSFVSKVFLLGDLIIPPTLNIKIPL